MRQYIFRSVWERRLGRCESPIEGRFLAAFCEMAIEHGYEIGRTPKEWRIGIEPQRQMDRVCLDFLISYACFNAVIEIAVECDGHEFHERTKAQAARDRSRDRALQAAGYRVFRFTGSEIHADAKGCAGEVLDMIEEFQTETIFGGIEQKVA